MWYLSFDFALQPICFLICDCVCVYSLELYQRRWYCIRSHFFLVVDCEKHYDGWIDVGSCGCSMAMARRLIFLMTYISPGKCACRYDFYVKFYFFTWNKNWHRVFRKPGERWTYWMGNGKHWTKLIWTFDYNFSYKTKSNRQRMKIAEKKLFRLSLTKLIFVCRQYGVLAHELHPFLQIKFLDLQLARHTHIYIYLYMEPMTCYNLLELN